MMNIQKMMKQAQQMQQKLQDVQAEAEARESEGSAGNGLVNVTINGKGTLLKLNVDASIVDPEDKEMMEDLIIAAYNDAKAKADAALADAMGEATGGMNLPAGMKLPF